MPEENASPAQVAMLETFQQHMAAEVTGDIEAAMATMTDNPLCQSRTGDGMGSGKGTAKFEAERVET